MKISSLIPLALALCSGILQANPAGGQSPLNTKLSISIGDTRLDEAMDRLAGVSGISFFYDAAALAGYRVNRQHFVNTPVREILDTLLEKTLFRYRESDGSILIVRKPREEAPAARPGQQRTIRGKVTDRENGSPLPGVAVRVKGTPVGMNTDTAGNYQFEDVPEDAVLVFSLLGYQTQEIRFSGQQVLNIALAQDISGLEELVVIGYGKQERKDVTGAVSSVTAEQIRDLPVPNFEQALKGQVAGVQVVQNTGSPSSGTTIKIRGSGSITAGNEPLYVIDGLPITGGGGGTGNIPGGANPLNNINPNHIESIDILKDASATAIYGSQGANGVVIITTKSGAAGEGTFTLDIATGWQTPTKKLDRLNAAEFAEYHIESRYNGWLRSGGDPDAPNGERGSFNVPDIYYDPSRWNPTDWQDEVLRTGMIQHYNLTASGGTDALRYAIMGEYAENQGIIIESSMKRYSFRANVDADVNDKLTIGFRLNPSYTVHGQVSTEGHFRGSLLGMALSAPPVIGPYQPDGSYTNLLALRGADGLGGLGAVDNPVAHARENQFDLDRGRILGNVYAEYQLLEHLSFRTSVGIDGIFNRTHVFLSSLTGRSGAAPPSVPEGSATSSQKLNWLNENLLTYERMFRDKHRVTAILGSSFQKNDYRNILVEGDQFPGDNVPYINAAGIVEAGTAIRDQWSMVSFYGRVNYGYDNRYLLTATIRQDGSSRFGAENKYGFFPSAAFAWRMSEEGFMENADWVSDLKWRMSYGVSGNHEIANYAHIARVSNVGYVLGADQHVVNAISQSSLANPFLTWETNRSYNLGVDIGLLDNRLTLTADAYRSLTDGLLLNVNIPAVSGFTNTLENIGEVENKGLELAVSSVNLATEAVYWNTSFNIAFNRNKILALGGSAGDFIDAGRARNVVGQSMGLFYARVTEGIFNSQEEIGQHVPQDNNPAPGDRRFRDVNGDGVVNNDDRDFVGDPNPDFTFGFSNSFSYKGFELNMLINGSYGNDAFYNYAIGTNLNGNINQDGVVRGRWRSPEDPGSGIVPAVVNGLTTLAGEASDFFVFDASYLRLTNLTLAYNIPSSVAQRVGFRSARVSLSGQNLFTLTSYPGYDPETASGGENPVDFADDRVIYPLARVITAGVNITF